MRKQVALPLPCCLSERLGRVHPLPASTCTTFAPPPPHQQGGKLESEAVVQLEPPAAGCRPVTATATPERTAVLWSDGTVAVYTVPGDKQPLLPLPTGPSRQAVVRRRLAGFRLPQGKQHKAGGGGSKKRGAAAEPEAASGGASMAAIGDKQVAVVGWASTDEGGQGAVLCLGWAAVLCRLCCCWVGCCTPLLLHGTHGGMACGKGADELQYK